jgi:ribosomal protein S1/tetratricopeptide (TPR) repeat protein
MKRAPTKDVAPSKPAKFPRGGGSVLTPLEMKQVAKEAAEAPLDDSLFDEDMAEAPVETQKERAKKKDNVEKKSASPLISFQSIAVGSLLLGIVKDASKANDVVISLPAGLVGFYKDGKHVLTEDSYVMCVVLSKDDHRLLVSVDPSLLAQKPRVGGIMQCVVTAVEDHGYSVQGGFYKAKPDGSLSVDSIVLATVESVKGNKVIFSPLKKDKLHDDPTLDTLFPGSLVIPSKLDLFEIPYTISMMHSVNGDKSAKARVIYADMSSKKIYLSQLPHHVSLTMPSISRQVGDVLALENPVEIPNVGLLYRNANAERFFVYSAHKGTPTASKVISVNLFDGIYNVSQTEPLLIQDLSVGQKLKGTVESVLASGVISVTVPKALGFKVHVPLMHQTAQAKITAGSPISGIVVRIEGQKVLMSTKKECANISIKSFDEAKEGAISLGVVAAILDNGALVVEFLGGAKGIVPQRELGESKGQFHVGSFLRVRIVTVDKESKRMGLSLDLAGTSDKKQESKKREEPILTEEENVGWIRGRSANGLFINYVEGGAVRVGAAFERDVPYPLATYKLHDLVDFAVRKVDGERIFLTLKVPGWQVKGLQRYLAAVQKQTDLKIGQKIDCGHDGKIDVDGYTAVFHGSLEKAKKDPKKKVKGVVLDIDAESKVVDVIASPQKDSTVSLVKDRYMAVVHDGRILHVALDGQTPAPSEPKIDVVEGSEPFVGTLVKDEKPKDKKNKEKACIVAELHPTYALCSLGDRKARLSMADISTEPVAEPLKTLTVGQSYPCRVLESSSGKFLDISLVLAEDEREFSEGDAVFGYVTSVTAQGVFVKVRGNRDGRCQLRELAANFVKDPSKAFPVGKLVSGFVLSYDSASRRLEMTLRDRAAEEKAREEKEKSKKTEGEVVIKKGTVFEGTVKQIEKYGLFVRIPGSKKMGLAHISKISDNKIEDLSKMFSVGQTIRCVILHVDDKKGRIVLGCKQRYFDNPLPLAATVPQVGKKSVNSDEEESSSEDDADVDMEEANHDDDVESEDDDNESEDNSEEDDDDEDDDEEEDDGFGFSMWKSQKKSGAAEASVADEDEVADDNDVDSDDDMFKPNVDGDDVALDSVDAFEQAIVSTPASSALWIHYMAHHVTLQDIDEARHVAERALVQIPFREDGERFNMWVALLNLEARYGSDETLDEVFARALQFTNAKHVALKFVSICQHTDRLAKAEEVFKSVLAKKHKESAKVWIAYMTFLMDQNRAEEARQLLSRALTCLPQRKHIKVRMRLAQLEFKHQNGEKDRGRTMFEKMVVEQPRRTDLWSVYADTEISSGGDLAAARRLLDRCISVKTSARNIKMFFKKYLAFEKTKGTDEGVEYVKQKAREYISTA